MTVPNALQISGQTARAGGGNEQISCKVEIEGSKGFIPLGVEKSLIGRDIRPILAVDFKGNSVKIGAVVSDMVSS